jgi:hypothetical protein
MGRSLPEREGFLLFFDTPGGVNPVLPEKNIFIQKRGGIWYNGLETYSIKFNIICEFAV